MGERDKSKLRHKAREGSETNAPFECRVAFLGDAGAGKTSLIERIIHPDRPFVEGASMPTNGIRMERWPPVQGDGNPLRKLLGDQPLLLRLWDFGGQEIMQSLHRCFMSKHTVYVVVCDSQRDTNIDINAAYWIETVKEFAPDCPVILALNKADLNHDVSVNIRDLQRRNPTLRKPLKTSANPNSAYGIEGLLRQIIKEARQCADLFLAGEDWLSIKRELEDMPEDYITSEQYKHLCQRHHIFDNGDQRDMLDWFQDLGIVYSYSEGKAETLDSTLHVLNPEWLSNGAYRLILHAPEGGFLTMKEIRETLRTVYPGDISKNEYEFRADTGVDEPEFILHVIRKFGISRQWHDGRELIPSRLPKTPPNEAGWFDKSNALHLRWIGSYLPRNLAQRLIIEKFDQLKLDELEETPCVWRTGGWFYQNPAKPEGSQALVEMNERQLDLYVINHCRKDCRPYLADMRESVRRILSDFNLNAQEQLFWGNGYISYNSLIAQYSINEEGEVFIEDPARVAHSYVKSKTLLDKFYANVDELVWEYRQAQEHSFDSDVSAVKNSEEFQKDTTVNITNNIYGDVGQVNNTEGDKNAFIQGGAIRR